MKSSIQFVARVLASIAVFALAGTAPAAAQTTWKPARSIEYINPAAPGGSVDLMIRMTKKFAEDAKLHDLGANVLYKTGANGGIAMGYMMQAAGGNETLVGISHTFLTHKLTGESRYDWRDVTPVGILFKEYHVIAVRADSGIRDGLDLIERLKRDPSSISFGFFGNRGNHLHLAAALPLKAAGVDIRKLTTVPYRSGPEAITAVLGGHLDAALVSAVNTEQFVAAGKMRVLTQTAGKRLPGFLQQVPTWKELGVNIEYATAQGFAGPRGMAPEAVAWWEGVLGRLSRDEEWNRVVARSMWENAYMSAAQHRRYYEEEFPKLQAALVELGLVK